MPSPEPTKEQQIERLTVAHNKALGNLLSSLADEREAQRKKAAAISDCSIIEDELRALKQDILSPIV